MRGFGLQAAVPGRANLDYGGLERDLEPDVLILRGRVGACENKDCLVMCEEKGTVRVRESISRRRRIKAWRVFFPEGETLPASEGTGSRSSGRRRGGTSPPHGE